MACDRKLKCKICVPHYLCFSSGHGYEGSLNTFRGVKWIDRVISDYMYYFACISQTKGRTEK